MHNKLLGLDEKKDFCRGARHSENSVRIFQNFREGFLKEKKCFEFYRSLEDFVESFWIMVILRILLEFLMTLSDPAGFFKKT